MFFTEQEMEQKAEQHRIDVKKRFDEHKLHYCENDLQMIKVAYREGYLDAIKDVQKEIIDAAQLNINNAQF